jgi:hypothetical protein
MITIQEAIHSLKPNAQWSIDNNNYAGLEWLDTTQTKPTLEEVNAEIARLQADYDAKQYQRDRANAYPSIVDQLDTLYHGGYDAWKANIQAIKDQFPKGAA